MSTIRLAHLKWVWVFGFILTGTMVFADTAVHRISRKKAYLLKNFDKAAKEFNVPVEILKTIAYVETRWNHTLSASEEELETAQENTSETSGTNDSRGSRGESYRHLKVYGVMGLKNDPVNGTSLKEAAKLIDQPPERLKRNIEQNIRGAAALLDYHYRTSKKPVEGMKPNPSILEVHRNWSRAIQLYSGLSPEDAKYYLDEILEAIEEIDEDARGDARVKKIAANVDLPKIEASLKIEQLLSPNHSSGGIRQLFVIIHTTQGNFASALSWLRKKESQASSHYLIRSRDGHIVQLVEEKDKAWHARCWNGVAIGIEHEGFVDAPEYLTKELYESSARLVAVIANRYGIAPDQTHIVGHDFTYSELYKKNPPKELANCNSHHDPGSHWDWDSYINLVKQLLLGTPNPQGLDGANPDADPKPAGPPAIPAVGAGDRINA